MKNKVFAVKKKDDNWWSVIDCGESKKGGMSTGSFWFTHFEKDGKTYRWFKEIFNPPTDLTEWKEIEVREVSVCLIVNDKSKESSGHLSFEGWEDKEDLGFETLQKFSKRIGHEMTIEEIKEIVNNG